MLPTDLDVERWVRQVRTAVTVATPHHGTPLAAFFTSLLGRQVLRALSLSTIYLLRFGSLPVTALLELGAAIARVDGLVGLNSALLDELYEQLLPTSRPSAGGRSTAFFARGRGRPGAAHAAHPRGHGGVRRVRRRLRPGVRAGSVVTRARRPVAERHDRRRPRSRRPGDQRALPRARTAWPACRPIACRRSTTRRPTCCAPRSAPCPTRPPTTAWCRRARRPGAR